MAILAPLRDLFHVPRSAGINTDVGFGPFLVRESYAFVKVMKAGLEPGIGLLLWSLFVGLGTGLFFSLRIRRKKRRVERSASFKTLILHNEYLRNDVYGALLGWVGCVFVLIVFLSMRV